jgi:hypothetical protein
MPRCAASSRGAACALRRSSRRTWRSTRRSPSTAAKSAAPRRCRRWPPASPPHTDFNPVLLKPSTDKRAQVIIHGKALQRPRRP